MPGSQTPETPGLYDPDPVFTQESQLNEDIAPVQPSHGGLWGGGATCTPSSGPPHLYVSDAQLSLHVVTDHEVAQVTAGGDLGLLDDVGAEADLAEVLVLLDRRGDGQVRLAWGGGMGAGRG